MTGRQPPDGCLSFTKYVPENKESDAMPANRSAINDLNHIP
jgi:hypothetical protein